jgi:hypothetical protein
MTFYQREEQWDSLRGKDKHEDKKNEPGGDQGKVEEACGTPGCV